MPSVPKSLSAPVSASVSWNAQHYSIHGLEKENKDHETKGLCTAGRTGTGRYDVEPHVACGHGDTRVPMLWSSGAEESHGLRCRVGLGLVTVFDGGPVDGDGADWLYTVDERGKRN